MHEKCIILTDKIDSPLSYEFNTSVSFIVIICAIAHIYIRLNIHTWKHYNLYMYY